MDDGQDQTNQILFYIVAIAILAFMLIMWYKQPNSYVIQPNYPTYYIHNNKQHIRLVHSNDNINTESVTLGGHNSAHNSPIIASPYNPLPHKSKYYYD
jgi:hypothetical protein